MQPLDLRMAIYSILYDCFDTTDVKFDQFGCFHQHFLHKAGHKVYVLFDEVENHYFRNKYDNHLYGACPDELLNAKHKFPVSLMVIEPEVHVP